MSETIVANIQTILVGDSGVGKTDFINSYLGSVDKVKAVVHPIDFPLTNTLGVRFTIWDCGQEFASKESHCKKEIDAAILMFDLTNRESLENLIFYQERIQQLSEKQGKDIPMAIVGNKWDAPREDQIPMDELPLEVIKISNKSKLGVALPFLELVGLIAEKKELSFSE